MSEETESDTNVLVLDRISVPVKKHANYVQKFRKEWLHDPEFQDWLIRVPGNENKAMCKWCRRELKAKRHDLKSHVKTKKHMLIAEQVNSGYTFGKKDQDVVGEEEINSPNERFITILREISAMEENKLNDSSVIVPHERDKDDGCLVINGMSNLIKGQSEHNTLLHALINVQRERLELEKKRLAVEEEILSVLNSKITVSYSG